MIKSMTSSQPPQTLQIPIARSAHQLAGEQAAQQSSVEQGRRIYLNTLAALSVQSWLRCMQIETDESASLSQHAGLHGLLGTADLWLPDYGRLLCQPVLEGERTVTIPRMEADDMGCLIVEFAETLEQASLIGFFEPAVEDKLVTVPIQEVRSLSEFLTHLHQLKALQQNALTPLRQWLDGVFDQPWQSLENLLGQPSSDWSLAYRSQPTAVERARRIETPAGQAFLLRVTVDSVAHSTEAAAADMTEVQMRLYPENQTYLPSGVTLSLLSPDAAPLQQVTARDQDNFIQLLPFRCLPDEAFSLRIELGSWHLTAAFTG